MSGVSADTGGFHNGKQPTYAAAQYAAFDPLQSFCSLHVLSPASERNKCVAFPSTFPFLRTCGHLLDWGQVSPFAWLPGGS